MHEILTARAWALESSFFDRISPHVIKAIQNGKSLDHLVKTPEEKAKAMSGSLEWDDKVGAPVVITDNHKRIGLVSVIGTMTKRGDLCSYGMKHLGGKIARMNASEGIDAIVVEFDTPGGTVDGTPEFGKILKNSQKPIVSYMDGMMCSAGYWAGSQTSYIIANANNPGMIGSIGTLCMHIDQSEYLKKEGLKVEIIRAEQSKDKARGNSIEGLPDDARAQLIQELNQITESFIATVREGRGDRLKAGKEDIFTGKVYDEKKALQLGMIDALGTFQDAINKAEELANQSSISIKSNSNKNANSDMKILSILGLSPAVESKLSAEERTKLEAAEAKLTEIETEKATAVEAAATAQASLETAQADNEALKATNEGLTNQVAELEGKVAKLEGKPDTPPAGAHHESDDNGGDAGKKVVRDEQAHRFAAMGAARKKSLE